MVLEPQDLGDFHLNAHLASNILEQLVISGIDLFCLLDRTVVQPENDVAVVAIVGEIGAGNGNRLVGIVGEDGQGAGGVEADTLDLVWVDERLLHNSAHALADTAPDVCCGLFLEKTNIEG